MVIYVYRPTRRGPRSRLVVSGSCLIAALVLAVVRMVAGTSALDGIGAWALVLAVVGVLLASQHVHEGACDDEHEHEGGR